MVAERRPEQPVAERPRLRVVRGRALPLVRRDALPEHTEYADTGCAVAPSCLRCPLARCRYDAPPPAQEATARRDREIALLRRRHAAPVDALARTYGLTRRSIFRILREQA